MSGCSLGDTERSRLASLWEEEPARLPGQLQANLNRAARLESYA